MKRIKSLDMVGLKERLSTIEYMALVLEKSISRETKALEKLKQDKIWYETRIKEKRRQA